ncbi:MAG: L,D-transpeptidase [Patescibacteria group bacterium]
MDKINRRKFLTGVGAATLVIAGEKHLEKQKDTPQTTPPSRHEKPTPPEKESHVDRPLSLNDLEKHKQEAIDYLLRSIPSDSRADYLREHAQYLDVESQMYLPDTEELKNVVEKSGQQLAELRDAMGHTPYGLFAFADIDNKGKRFQRLYVVQKNPSNQQLEFVKAYKAAMSRNGFGSAKNQTPLGLYFMKSERKGLYGEIVSAEQKYNDKFNPIPDDDGVLHWFTWGFGQEKYNRIAEVVTARYTFNETRGFHVHGTNRSGEWEEFQEGEGMWRSFLGGEHLSTGCIRLSNVDSIDTHKYITTPSIEGKHSNNEVGTPIMIYATPAAINQVRKKEGTNETKIKQPKSLGHRNPEAWNPFSQLD